MVTKKESKDTKDKGKSKAKADNEAKLVVFGSGGVGKSALIVQLIQGVFIEQYDPTLEDSYRKDMEYQDKPIVLDILDTAGQEEFHSLRDQYIRQGDGYIIVYSVTNRQTFDEVVQFLEQIVESKELEDTTPEHLAAEIPIVLVGNKCDLEKERQITFEEGQQLADKYGKIQFYEASAKTRKNVHEIFLDCAVQVFEKVKKKKSSTSGASSSKEKKDCSVQ